MEQKEKRSKDLLGELIQEKNIKPEEKDIMSKLTEEANKETRQPLDVIHVEMLSPDEYKKRDLEERKEMEVQLAGPVTVDSYQKAVQILLDATQMSGTSGSRVAARLLLALYNSDQWHFNFSELALLDFDLYPAAITAIRGRFEVYMEPHSLIEGGSRIFGDLWDEWIRYHKSNAWKDECNDCWGRGTVYDDEGDPAGECSTCNGRGLRDPVEEMADELKRIATFSPRSSDPDPIETLKCNARWALSRQGISLDDC